MDLQPTPLPPRLDWRSTLNHPATKISAGVVVLALVGLVIWWFIPAPEPILVDETTAPVVDSSLPTVSDQQSADNTINNQPSTVTDSTITTPSVVGVDTDGDGLADELEVSLGTDPNKADTDGDGYSDDKEIQNGYDPTGPGKTLLY